MDDNKVVMKSSPAFRALLILFAVALGSVLGIGLFAMNSSDKSLRGAASDPPRDVSELHMTDVDGRDERFVPPPGNVMLTFFGFTHCPDVCPTTMSDIRTAINAMGAKGSRVKMSMVSVDPARDSAPVLGSYVAQFFDKNAGSGFRTDDQAHLQQVARAFGASYEVHPPAAAGDEPEVMHTAWLYAVDDTGHIRAQWSFGTPTADIVHDLKILLS
jgi:protein SCO1/2